MIVAMIQGYLSLVESPRDVKQSMTNTHNRNSTQIHMSAVPGMKFFHNPSQRNTLACTIHSVKGKRYAARLIIIDKSTTVVVVVV